MKKLFYFQICVILLFGLSACSVLPQKAESVSSEENISQDADGTTNLENLDNVIGAAESLTSHLVVYSFPFGAENGYATLEDLIYNEKGDVIYHFVTSQHFFFSDEADPYHTLFDKNELITDTTVSMPLAEVQTMVEQVFGISDWFVDKDCQFDEEKQCFHFPLEVGTYSYYTADIVHSQKIDDKIVVTLVLKNSSYGESIPKEYGEYNITYGIVSDSGGDFLRFESFMPAEAEK